MSSLLIDNIQIVDNRKKVLNPMDLSKGYTRKVIHADWMSNNIPDKSVSLLMVDPPYYQVKGDFDFIWSSFEDYLKDVEKWVIECKRILKDNGSLYWWGHARNIAYTQIILDKYFTYQNSLVWEKSDCQTRKGSDNYRSYAPVTERCLFYSNPEINTNDLCVGNVRDYIRSEIIKSKGKIVLKEVNSVLGTATNGGGVASSVLSLDKSVPAMITEGHYNKLRSWLNAGEDKNYLCKPYGYLKSDYEELKHKNEMIRRPWINDLKMTDVINHSQQVNISGSYNHETQKPVNLIKMLMQNSTRKNDIVVIPFGGSGTDVEACIELGLQYVCYEIDDKHYNTIIDRERELLKQPLLF